MCSIEGNNNEGEVEGHSAGAESGGSIKVANMTYEIKAFFFKKHSDVKPTILSCET